MPRFFVEEDQIQGGELTMTGPDARHVAGSLRVRPGEHVLVVAGGRTEHSVEITEASRDCVRGRIAWSRPATGDAHLGLHVVQSLAARGMDDAIEMMAVAGVAAIHPVLTARATSRPDAQRGAARLERWRLIAREAAQLAGRATPPAVHPVLPLAAAVDALPPRCRILAAVVNAAVALSETTVDADTPLAVVIGPEGGLDATDLRVLADHGAEEVHMGPRVLPSRLAGFWAASVILSRAGDTDRSRASDAEQ